MDTDIDMDMAWDYDMIILEKLGDNMVRIQQLINIYLTLLQLKHLNETNQFP
jgi:hypothetical protein